MTTESTPTALADGGDPADFGVDEVNDYLTDPTTPADGYARVIAAEQAGKARTTIVGKATTDDGQPVGPSVDMVLVQHWTDGAGKNHLPGDPISVDHATAETLRNTSWATDAKSA